MDFLAFLDVQCSSEGPALPSDFLGLSRLIWSYPETVLGPFQAAYMYLGPTLLILVLHLGPFQAAHFGPTLTKDRLHINLNFTSL